MIGPRLHRRFLLLIVFAAMWAPGFVSQAEQPPSMSPSPAESKAAPPPRAKPQVIYHLPRTSSYAATLHSQAKTQSNALPGDSNRPSSLQASRPAANETAAGEQQQQTAPKVDSSRQHRVKRPKKVHSNQPQMRKQGPGKARGPGPSHGNKSRKK